MAIYRQRVCRRYDKRGCHDTPFCFIYMVYYASTSPLYTKKRCHLLWWHLLRLFCSSELLTRLGLLRFALPRGAMRIKESPMVRSKRTTFHFVYRAYYASILHPIYKIKDATISGGIIVASFALQSC